MHKCGGKSMYGKKKMVKKVTKKKAVKKKQMLISYIIFGKVHQRWTRIKL